VANAAQAGMWVGPLMRLQFCQQAGLAQGAMIVCMAKQTQKVCNGQTIADIPSLSANDPKPTSAIRQSVMSRDALDILGQQIAWRQITDIAAMRASKTIPIVMTVSTEPVASS
jgi:hypothetical protein